MVEFSPEQQEFSTVKSPSFLSISASFRPNVSVHYLLFVASVYFPGSKNEQQVETWWSGVMLTVKPEKL